MSEGSGHPIGSPGTRRVPMWSVLAVAGALAAVAVLVVVLITRGGAGVEPGPAAARRPVGILAVAFGLSDGAPGLTGYVGNPAADPFRLPPGRYYVEALDAAGLVASLGVLPVDAAEVAPVPVSLEASGGAPDPARAAQLKLVVTSLVLAERAKLAALRSVSGGFTAELFDAAAIDAPADFDALMALYQDLAAVQTQTVSAVDAVEMRADAAVPRAALVTVTTDGGPEIQFGVFGAIKDELLGFFGYAGDAGKRARDDLINIGSRLNPSDKQDAFGFIPQAHRGGTRNFDEYLERLASGDLDTSAANVRAILVRTSVGFAAAAQDTLGDRPGLSIAHREGAELVRRGAELNVKVIKTVLGDVFPGIDQGFDLADDVDAWLEYVRDVYRDPLGSLEASARDRITEDLKGRIQQRLEDLGLPLSADEIEELADEASGKLVDAIPELAPDLNELLAQAAGATPTPLPTAVPTATAAPPPPVTTTRVPVRTVVPNRPPVPPPTPRPAPPPAPDTSWVEPVVQDVGAALTGGGVPPEVAQIFLDDLRACLLDGVRSDLTRPDAIARCQAQLDTPTPAADTPLTGTVVARGAVDLAASLPAEAAGLFTVTGSEMSITFPAAGGGVTGNISMAAEVRMGDFLGALFPSPSADGSPANEAAAKAAAEASTALLVALFARTDAPAGEGGETPPIELPELTDEQRQLIEELQQCVLRIVSAGDVTGTYDPDSQTLIGTTALAQTTEASPECGDELSGDTAQGALASADVSASSWTATLSGRTVTGTLDADDGSSIPFSLAAVSAGP